MYQQFQGRWYPNVPYQYETKSDIDIFVETRNNDQACIEKFVEENAGDSSFSNNGKCKISEAKMALSRVNSMNEELSSIAENLRDGKLSNIEWEEKRKKSEDLREEIEKVMERFRDEKFVEALKKSVMKRKKKRIGQKKKKEEWKLKKKEREERKLKVSREIDEWMKNKMEGIEKEKQEEDLRKQADAVLFDVRQKRNDAKKFLSVLKELENLRRIKVGIVKARGEHVALAAEESFQNIIVKLVEQWTQLDREYSLEEQGLKLMIKTDNELKIRKQKKIFFDDWENALFGRTIPANYFLQGDVETFITMRTAWDKFINPTGSPIPIGWVMPKPPSSSGWEKYLKNQDSTQHIAFSKTT